MAKFVSDTGLAYFYNRIKLLFASQSDFNALDTKVDGIIAEGGEPNTIETISVNGTNVAPDAQKNVALTIPTQTSQLTNNGDGTSNFATEAYVAQNGGKIDKIQVNGVDQTITNKTVNVVVPTKVSDLTNDGDGTAGSEFATKSYVDQNGGKIDVIKVNNVAQTITNKEVNITVPTAVSSLNNDSGYQTASEVQTAISAAVASAYKYKGSVATVSDLPASGNTVGDVYDVQSNGINYAWTGTEWDALGQLIDTSLLWAKSELVAITTAEIDAIVDGTSGS